MLRSRIKLCEFLSSSFSTKHHFSINLKHWHLTSGQSSKQHEAQSFKIEGNRKIKGLSWLQILKKLNVQSNAGSQRSLVYLKQASQDAMKGTKRAWRRTGGPRDKIGFLTTEPSFRFEAGRQQLWCFVNSEPPSNSQSVLVTFYITGN